MSDILVEEERRVREELIRSFGGIDGYLRHCQNLDRTLAVRSKASKTNSSSRGVPRQTKKPNPRHLTHSR